MNIREYLWIWVICLIPVFLEGPIDNYFYPPYSGYLFIKWLWSAFIAYTCLRVSLSKLAICVASLEVLALLTVVVISFLYNAHGDPHHAIRNIIMNVITILELAALCYWLPRARICRYIDRSYKAACHGYRYCRDNWSDREISHRDQKEKVGR